MKYNAEINFQTEGFKEYNLEKADSIYTDRAIVADKAKKIFLLTTFDLGEVPDDYRDFVQALAVDFELSVNYIPVFFGGDYDDVMRIMDDFVDKLKNDYM